MSKHTITIYHIGTWELIFVDDKKIFFHDQRDLADGLSLIQEEIPNAKMEDIIVSQLDSSDIIAVYSTDDGRWESSVPDSLSTMNQEIKAHQKKARIAEAEKLEARAKELRDMD